MSATTTLLPLSTPKKKGSGWVIEIPPDMAQIMGVAEGSIGMLYARPGGVELEILPPLDPDLVKSVLEGCEEMRETCEELKRLGD